MTHILTEADRVLLDQMKHMQADMEHQAKAWQSMMPVLEIITEQRKEQTERMKDLTELLKKYNEDIKSLTIQLNESAADMNDLTTRLTALEQQLNDYGKKYGTG